MDDHSKTPSFHHGTHGNRWFFWHNIHQYTMDYHRFTMDDHTISYIYHGFYHCCRFFSDLMYGSVVFSFDTMMLCKRLGEKYPLNCWIFEVQAMSRHNHCLMSRFFRGQRPIFTHVPSDMVVCLIPYPIILCISLYTVYIYICIP